VIIPIFFSLASIVGSLFLPRWLCTGATVVLLEKFDEEIYFQSFEKYKINVLPVFPTFGHKLIKGELANKLNLSSVKMMNSGAAAFPANVSEAILKKYNLIFHECMCFSKKI
jgi:acyl-coenzyme A synthetase/AMP-(fatty) acid ligase